tara:strand:+ start:558 stop:1205 length:648 start_codon:yes stop_codon:yes gene_type:complete
MRSVWGCEEPETIELLENTDVGGIWLDLAAGDGRYSNLLLKRAEKVVALDTDSSALDTLLRQTPVPLRKKLVLKSHDATKKLPFKDSFFDGIFCTGTFHMCGLAFLQSVFAEIARVIKQNGMLIFDFAADIKRVLPDGALYKYDDKSIYGKLTEQGSEPDYKLEPAKNMLKQLLIQNNFEIENLITTKVSEEPEIAEGHEVIFSCNFLLISAKKK